MGTIAQLFETGEHAAQKGHFHNLVMLARVDGKIDTTEKNLLARIAQRLSLTDAEVKSICDDEDSYPIYPPVSKEERLERFIQLIEMIVVDGKVNSDEEHLITKYGVELGIDTHEIDSVYKKVIPKVIEGVDRETIVSSLM